MDYDQFVEKSKTLGTGLIDLLPTYFKKFDDETEYPVSEVAEHLSVSEETVRRWCRNGELISEGITHYRINGLVLKRYLFNKSKNRFPKTLKEIIEE
ncbi:helix-turn-helix domain-containing protein [Bacillus sp. RO1]|uniref:helix-turn-helix domain-containing protein n=1 Tax=Bacillus sp. RO1 TaxID=2722703 RepID=UPI0014576871|nr:helix-turn-helix domain-containing protein [Bacillus sp. RO1]NLP50239.1 helix-turn-helix domain-containing protein [Bacillus sp. RO1]